jgi:hypothetical protein
MNFVLAFKNQKTISLYFVVPKNDTKAKLLMHMFHGRHDDLDILVKLQEYFLLHAMVVLHQKKWGKAFENDFNKGITTILVVALGCFTPINGNPPPQKPKCNLKKGHSFYLI